MRTSIRTSLIALVLSLLTGGFAAPALASGFRFVDVRDGASGKHDEAHGREHRHRRHHRNRDHRSGSRRLRQCAIERTGGEVSRGCFALLLEEPEVAAVLGDRKFVPALADGRLSLEKILGAMQISDAAARTRPGEEADPEPDEVLETETLEQLREAEGFEIDSTVFTSRGPIQYERYVPKLPSGFPLVAMPDNKTFLDIPGFTLDLHETLNTNVNGYAMRMLVNGQIVSTLQWNWARNPNLADAPAAGWNTSRRMHIVSLSKFMSAIGLIHLLRDKTISTNTKIIGFLPAYWNPGPGVGGIDFEQLMNHVSGLSSGNSASDWSTMQAVVEAGVNNANVGVYQNLNFGLLRILIATIAGYINPAASVGNGPLSELFNDLLWSGVTASAYNDYMQTHVFNPVGAFPVLTKSPTTALAHRYDASGTGWDTGSFFGSPGGVGWHLTINEVLQVARGLRTGQILAFSDAQELLDKSWGLNSPVNGFPTDAGPVYYKPGRWQDNNNASVARAEQCVLMMMPNNMEVAVFVNSPIGPTGQSLTNIVRTIYLDNLITPP